MKMRMKFIALLLSVFVGGSSCAAVSYPVSDTAERINWREYSDC